MAAALHSDSDHTVVVVADSAFACSEVAFELPEAEAVVGMTEQEASEEQGC